MMKIRLKSLFESLLLAGLMVVLVPAARAVDLTIDDATPAILFDDSDDEAGSNATRDWQIWTDGGPTTGILAGC